MQGNANLTPTMMNVPPGAVPSSSHPLLMGMLSGSGTTNYSPSHPFQDVSTFPSMPGDYPSSMRHVLPHNLSHMHPNYMHQQQALFSRPMYLPSQHISMLHQQSPMTTMTNNMSYSDRSIVIPTSDMNTLLMTSTNTPHQGIMMPGNGAHIYSETSAPNSTKLNDVSAVSISSVQSPSVVSISSVTQRPQSAGEGYRQPDPSLTTSSRSGRKRPRSVSQLSQQENQNKRMVTTVPPGSLLTPVSEDTGTSKVVSDARPLGVMLAKSNKSSRSNTPVRNSSPAVCSFLPTTSTEDVFSTEAKVFTEARPSSESMIDVPMTSESEFISPNQFTDLSQVKKEDANDSPSDIPADTYSFSQYNNLVSTDSLPSDGNPDSTNASNPMFNNVDSADSGKVSESSLPNLDTLVPCDREFSINDEVSSSCDVNPTTQQELNANVNTTDNVAGENIVVKEELNEDIIEDVMKSTPPPATPEKNYFSVQDYLQNLQVRDVILVMEEVRPFQHNTKIMQQLINLYLKPLLRYFNGGKEINSSFGCDPLTNLYSLHTYKAFKSPLSFHSHEGTSLLSSSSVSSKRSVTTTGSNVDSTDVLAIADSSIYQLNSQLKHLKYFTHLYSPAVKYSLNRLLQCILEAVEKHQAYRANFPFLRHTMHVLLITLSECQETTIEEVDESVVHQLRDRHVTFTFFNPRPLQGPEIQLMQYIWRLVHQSDSVANMFPNHVTRQRDNSINKFSSSEWSTVWLSPDLPMTFDPQLGLCQIIQPDPVPSVQSQPTVSNVNQPMNGDNAPQLVDATAISTSDGLFFSSVNQSTPANSSTSLGSNVFPSPNTSRPLGSVFDDGSESKPLGVSQVVSNVVMSPYGPNNPGSVPTLSQLNPSTTPHMSPYTMSSMGSVPGSVSVLQAASPLSTSIMQRQHSNPPSVSNIPQQQQQQMSASNIIIPQHQQQIQQHHVPSPTSQNLSQKQMPLHPQQVQQSQLAIPPQPQQHQSINQSASVQLGAPSQSQPAPHMMVQTSQQPMQRVGANTGVIPQPVWEGYVLFPQFSDISLHMSIFPVHAITSTSLGLPHRLASGAACLVLTFHRQQHLMNMLFSNNSGTISVYRFSIQLKDPPQSATNPHISFNGNSILCLRHMFMAAPMLQSALHMVQQQQQQGVATQPHASLATIGILCSKQAYRLIDSACLHGNSNIPISRCIESLSNEFFMVLVPQENKLIGVYCPAQHLFVKELGIALQHGVVPQRQHPASQQVPSNSQAQAVLAHHTTGVMMRPTSQPHQSQPGMIPSAGPRMPSYVSSQQIQHGGPKATMNPNMLQGGPAGVNPRTGFIGHHGSGPSSSGVGMMNYGPTQGVSLLHGQQQPSQGPMFNNQGTGGGRGYLSHSQGSEAHLSGMVQNPTEFVQQQQHPIQHGYHGYTVSGDGGSHSNHAPPPPNAGGGGGQIHF